MLDFMNRKVEVGDLVVIMHKKRPSTTATMQKGIVIRVTPKRAEVAVEGLNTTVHSSKTIVKMI